MKALQIIFIILLIVLCSCSSYKGSYDYIEKERKYYWYSYGQARIPRKQIMFVDGILYTEMTSDPKPWGNWSDYVLITVKKKGKIKVEQVPYLMNVLDTQWFYD